MQIPASKQPAESELGRLSATEIHDAIQSGKITVQQYAEALIRRCEERDGEIHAWVHFDKEAILSQARALDAVPTESRGLLHGVAIGIKDIFLTRDMPTRYFSPIHENDGNGASDSAAVGILRASGALLLGKTATTELASTMPTWGLISTEGVSRCSVTCDTVGYFANNVDDLNLLSRVFRLDLDRRGGDKDETPFRVRDARIAMVKTHVWELARPATRAAWQRARELLVGAGAQIEDVDLPGGFARAHAWREVIAGSEARSAFLSRYLEDKDKLHETLRPFVERRRTPGREEMLEAHDGVAALRREWDSVAARYDAVITPSVTGEAPEGLGDTGSAIFNAMWTVLHAPTLNVPGFVGENGMPVGLTVAGGRYTDMEVLRAGKAIGEVFNRSRE
ncbi:hypothetical protein PLIIFM63780_000149 [Purpureocillium lilacinum]|nr:hypothetical protein PLIIFM63780_000149 [Purpureocillium lilacinum]